jgi:serine/threonine protein kinase/WD40 repeat protein
VSGDGPAPGELGTEPGRLGHDLPGPETRELTPGDVVAGYRVEARIGAGGMAVVYRARDEKIQRLAALKVIAPEWAADREFRERFIVESRAAAKADHPHVIPVYKAGEDGGMLFIAMRLASGGDLRGVMQREGRSGLAPGRVLELLAPVAAALDSAHAAGLVHRDVKPTNILIDSGPGGAERVYLSDFGLTKDALSDEPLTQSGQYLGTPFYSAPEQAQGKKDLDGRADQYALACVAFELLTGNPPFGRDSVLAALSAHLTEPPPRLTLQRPDLPAAADAVLARTLAKAPADRYPSCSDFTGALATALTGKPQVPAIPERLRTPEKPVPGKDAWSRLGRWAARNRRLLIPATAGAVAVAVTVTLVLALAAPGPTRTAGKDTTGRAQTAASAAGPASASTRPATPSPSPASSAAVSNPGPAGGLASLVSTLGGPGDGSYNDEATEVAISPGGTTLAAGDMTGKVSLWNLATRKQVASLYDPEPMGTIGPTYPLSIPTPSFSEGPNGLPVLVEPTVLPALTGDPNPYTPLGGVGQLAFSPGTGGDILAAGYMDGSVYLWNTAAPAVVGTLSPAAEPSGGKAESREANAMAFTPDGSTLAVGDIDNGVYLYSTASQSVDGMLPDREGAYVESLTFAPDGTTLATGNGDGTVTLWDIVTRKVITTLNDGADADGVNALAFSPDGRSLVAGDQDGSAYLWNVAARKLTGTLADPRGNQGVSAVAFSPDGKAVAVGNGNGSVSVWLAASRKQTAGFFGPGSQGVSSLAFAPGGALLAGGDMNGNVYLWRITRQEAS